MRAGLSKLEQGTLARSIDEGLSVVYLSLPMFEKFASFLENHVETTIDTALLWGLFYFSVEVRCPSDAHNFSGLIYRN